MAKNAFQKDLYRAITGSKARFFSILVMIALGVGFFSGINATKPDMVLSADAYYKDYNLANFRIYNPLGYQEEDLAAVEETKEVLEVLRSYSKDLFVSSSLETAVTKVFSYDMGKEGLLNEPRVLEGRLPEASGEILLEMGAKNGLSISLGDEVTLSLPNGEELTDFIKEDTYKVVGFIMSPLYISFQRGQTNIGDGSIDYFAYVPQEDFSMEHYTDLFVKTVMSDDLEAYSKGYKTYHEPLLSSFSALGELAMARDTKDLREELEEGRAEFLSEKNDALKKIADAQEELLEAREEIQEGEEKLLSEEEKYTQEFQEKRQEILDGKEALVKGREEYFEGYAAWLEGYNDYQDGRAELQSAKSTLDLAKNQIDAGERELASAKAQLDSAKEQIALLETALQGLKDIRASLPETGGELTEEEYRQIIEDIRVFSPDLARLLEESVPYNDPNLVNALRTALDSGIIQLTDTLESAKKDYADGVLAYEEGQKTLAESKAAYEIGLQEYQQGERELAEAKKELDAGKAELDAAKKKLDDSEKILTDGEKALEEGEKTFKASMEEARADLEKGKAELREGEETFAREKADAEKKIADAEKEIRDAERALLEIPKEWFIYDREGFPGYGSLGNDADRLGSLATTFPLFFFLVAALVCLTTMTRMVEEERIQIGTLKALGYTTFTIAMKYISYALLASLLGSVLGFSIGFKLFPYIIITVYGAMYNTPYVLTPFHLDLALLSTAIAVFTTVSASLFATLSELRETPANLMMPKAPKPGKRILLERVPLLWKRMSFSYKVTFRNIFRYKKRFLMTVLGVSGCTALLVTGFGIQDSVNAIMGKQFEEIFLYDGLALLNMDKEEGERNLSEILGEEGEVERYGAFLSESIRVHLPGKTREYEATLMVPEEMASFGSFIDLHDRTSQEKIPLPEKGAVISEKLANLLGVSEGEELVYQDAENRTYTFTVTDITENYLAHYIYMSPEAFESLTLRKPEYNAGAFRYREGLTVDETALSQRLLENDGVLATVMVESIQEEFEKSISSLDYVIVILILAAGALAFVVLYNLTNINITERLREIATIKVLGFRDQEVASYVYRENVFLTIVGSLVGLVLGFSLHLFVIRTMEIDTMMFGRNIHVLSFLYSMVLTMAFSVFVNLFMSKKLQNIDMAASLKSVE